MKHFKHLTLLFALVLILAPAAFAQNEPIVIEYWDATGGEEAITQELVEEFNASHDDIQINLTIQPGNFVEVIDTAFLTESAPDVFRAAGVPRMFASGYLAPLDDLVDPDVIANFASFNIEGANVFDGQIYALPTNVVTFRLVYNADLFEEAGLDPDNPPATFDELVAAANTIAENTDAFGFGEAYAWNPAHNLFTAPMVVSSNPQLVRDGLFNRATGEYDLTAYAPAINALRQMVEDRSMFPGALSIDNHNQIRAEFFAGNLAMYIDNSNGYSQLVENAADMDWRATAVPIADGEEFVSTPAFAGRTYGIASSIDDEKREAAADVLEYLLSVEVTGELQSEGLLVAINPEASGEEFLPDTYGFEFFSFSEIDGPDYPTPNNLLNVQGRHYRDVLNELIFTDANIDEALQDVSERFTEAYNEGVEAGDIDTSVYETESE